MLTRQTVSALARQLKQCDLRRASFRQHNPQRAYDEAFLSGHLLHSSILRFVRFAPVFLDAQQHKAARPHDSIYIRRLLPTVRKSGLVEDYKMLKSRTRWISFDNKCRDDYLKALSMALKLFEVKK